MTTQLCTLGISTSPYRECRNIASRHITYPALGPDDRGSDICEFHWTVSRERGLLDENGEWK